MWHLSSSWGQAARSTRSNRCHSVRARLSLHHIRQCLSQRTVRPCCLTTLGETVQPDGGEWPIRVQQHFGSRPHQQFRRRRESGLSHTLHPPLLRDIRRDAQEPRQPRVLSRPFARGDVVCVGGKLEQEITHVHGALIPLQPEPHLLSSDAILRQCIGPEIVTLLTHPVAPLAHRPGLPPAQRLSCFSSGGLPKASEKAIDPSSVLNMLHKPGLSVLRHGGRFPACCLVGYDRNSADMYVVRSGEQTQAAPTEMPALANPGRERLKAT